MNLKQTIDLVRRLWICTPGGEFYGLSFERVEHWLREYQRLRKWHSVSRGDLPDSNRVVLVKARSKSGSGIATCCASCEKKRFWFFHRADVGTMSFPSDYEVIKWREVE